MTDELGIAVIGTSFMGRAHSNAWRNVRAVRPDLPAVRQRVLVGRDEVRTKESAERLGWEEAATDWRAVLERDDVDVVDVCTPGHLHHEIALAALAAGKHVLVEKPLTSTVPESEELVTAAAAAPGQVTMVGFNYRRVPALALARRWVGEGRIGRVRQVRAAYLQDWLVDAGAPMTWRLRAEEAGTGVLGDLGSHVVDQLRHLLGAEVDWATGHLATFVPRRPGPDGPERVTVDDAAWMTLGLRGGAAEGAVASVECSRMATGRKNALRLELYGERGSISFDLERLNELRVDTGGGDARVLVTEADHPYLEGWWPPGHTLGWDSTFTAQAADLLAAIARGGAVTPSFADGLLVQRVLGAVADSAAAGGVRVDLPRGPATDPEGP